MPHHMLVTTLFAKELLAVLGYCKFNEFFSNHNIEVGVTIETEDFPKIFVIHDGRYKENFPIFSIEPFMSIMEGSLNKKLPNLYRKTDLKDSEYGDKSNAKHEFLYSEFSPLCSVLGYTIHNSETRIIGKMHYRSYLNLNVEPYEVNKDKKNGVIGSDGKIVGDDTSAKIVETKGINVSKIFTDNSNKYKKSDNYVTRMGYTSENLKKIFFTQNFDILTSTPLNMNCNLTAQAIGSHAGGGSATGNPDATIFVKLLLIAGEEIANYNEKHFNDSKDNDDKLVTLSNIIKEIGEISTEDKKANCEKYSLSWDKYMGISDYVLNSGGTPADIDYFKDLVIFKNYYFIEYASFIYDILEHINHNHYALIKAFSRNKSRLLAYIGERITGYYIDYAVKHRGLKVGVVPRAHYGDDEGKTLSNFLTDLYPDYILKYNDKDVTLIPLFQFYKKFYIENGEIDRSKGLCCDTKYVIFEKNQEEVMLNNRKCILQDFAKVTGLENAGYAFEKCVGYICKDNVSSPIYQSYDSATNDSKLTSENTSELLGYSIPNDLNITESTEENAEDISKKVTLKLYYDNAAKIGNKKDYKLLNKNITHDGYESDTNFEISVVTFGRNDIL